MSDVYSEWEIFNMKRNYILDKSIKECTLISKEDMQKYRYSIDELEPVYRSYLYQGHDHSLFKKYMRNSYEQCQKCQKCQKCN